MENFKYQNKDNFAGLGELCYHYRFQPGGRTISKTGGDTDWGFSLLSVNIFTLRSTVVHCGQPSANIT